MTELKVDGFLLLLDIKPNSDILKDGNMDETGYIQTKQMPQKQILLVLFAAGDVQRIMFTDKQLLRRIKVAWQPWMRNATWPTFS